MSTTVEESVIAKPDNDAENGHPLPHSTLAKSVSKDLTSEDILDDSLDSSAESTLEGDFSAYGQPDDGQEKNKFTDGENFDIDAKESGEEISTATADLYDKNEMDFEDKDADKQIEELTGGLPVFANEKCKKLYSENKAYEKKLEALQEELVENKERLSIIEEHLSNVQQEVQHTNMLVDAKKKEKDTEVHLNQMSMRELGRYRKDIQRLQNEKNDVQDRLNITQNSIFTAHEEMDRFKLQMNWNQEELEQWATAAKQKEEDNLALQKYQRADEIKTKELTLNLEKLTEAAVDKQTKVEIEVTKTQAKQMELDRTADEFKALHNDRKRLVSQWQETVEAMKSRDEQINALGAKYATAKGLRNERLEILTEHKERLRLQEEENVEVEAKTRRLERTLQKMREENTAQQESLRHFQDSIDSLQSELASNAIALNKKNTENINLNETLEETRNTLEKSRKKYQEVKNKLDTETKNTHQVEVTVKEAELELNQKETKLKAAQSLLDQLKGTLFKNSQELSSCRKQETDLVAEIYGAKATAKNLKYRISQLNIQATKQSELVYNAEFQLQQMERKVARGLGERTDEEKKVLNDKIAALEKEVEEGQLKKKMLNAQLRKLSIEVKAALKRRESLDGQHEEIKSRIIELESENITTENKYKSVVKQEQEAMVQHDLMKLELRKLKDTLTSITDKLYLMQNRKEQLSLSMQERRQEVKVHTETQRAQIRLAEDEKRKVVVELNERTSNVERLKTRFEVLKNSAPKSDEDDKSSGEKSQAYYLIQVAQKREELQRKGDNLDQEIMKSERDIRGMFNVLEHLNDRNANLRVSLSKVTATSQEAEDVRKLEEQFKLVNDDLFHKKKVLQRLNTDVEEDETRLAHMKAQATQGEENINSMIVAVEQLKKTLLITRELEKKSNDKVNHELEKMKENKNDKVLANQKKQIKTNLLKESTLSILGTISQLIQKQPELASSMLEKFKAADISLPYNDA